MRNSYELQQLKRDAMIAKATADLIKMHEGVNASVEEVRRMVSQYLAEAQRIQRLPKGDKGDRGERGIQGPAGRPGKDGKDGKDGFLPVKGKDYLTKADEDLLVLRVLSRIKTPKDGETPVVDYDKIIEEAVEKLKGEKKLDWRDIGGLENELSSYRNQMARKQAGQHGGGTTVSAGTNITLTQLPDGTTRIDASGSGSSPLTTKGDLYGYSTQDARIPVGANGTVLTADSAEALGVKWATVSGTGDVVGPASSTENAIARYTDTSGKLIDNSGVTISDTDVVLIPSLTASEIVITDASKNLVSASVATYPSLTELSYVKGVTSAIQTQLNAKESALTFSTGLTRATNTITANISTGVAGSQTIYGGTAANEDLTIQGTTNATKTTSYVLIQPTGGNVGIGTTSPAQNFVVSNGGAAGLEVAVSSATTIQSYNRNTSAYAGLTFDGSVISFRPNGSSQLYIDTTGVGIGNTAPGQKLSITGDSTISGYLRVGSNSAPTNTTAGDLTSTRLIVGNGSLSGNVTEIGLFTGTLSATSGTSIAVNIGPSIAPAANSSAGYRALYMANSISAGASNLTASAGSTAAGFFVNSLSSSGTIAAISGIYSSGLSLGSTSSSMGTATEVAGGYFRGLSSGGNSLTSTITRALGVRIFDTINAGSGPLTVTGQAGLMIDSLTNATNNSYIVLGQSTVPTGNYAIYSASTNSSAFAGALTPTANDAAALGSASLSWSDLFLASGAVINFNNGNATLTHSTGLITSNVPFSVGTSNAITAGTIELGAATDTTISRSAAGQIAVEGVQVATVSNTVTLTNKTLTDPRISGASSGTAILKYASSASTTTFTFPEVIVGAGNTNVVSDSATQTLTNKIISHTVEPGTDDTFTGEQITGFNATATIAQWEAVYLSTTGWALTDADAAATAGGVMVGLAAAAGTNGNPLTVVTRGVIRNDGWTWATVGAPLYLSTTAGALTETAPSGTDDVVRIVGYVMSDDCIYLNPSNDWITRT